MMSLTALTDFIIAEYFYFLATNLLNHLNQIIRETVVIIEY